MINDSILIKFLAGELDSQQKDEVEKWLEKDPANVESLKSLKSIYNGEFSDFNQAELKLEWNKLENQISKVKAIKKSRSRRISSWSLRVAAVIILAIGTVFIFNLQKSEFTLRGTNSEPVAAFLPDGSEVLLTKGSRLTYSKDFNKEYRKVQITGDAFFNVTPDPERPFIVETGDAKIKVTGTSFHVSAPVRKDDIEVVVKSGKVLFYNSDTFSENSFKVGLGPGEKGTYSQKLKQLNKSHDATYTKSNIN